MHVMIDIETLGNLPTSVVTSIGAVRFDPTKPLPRGDLLDTFNQNVNINSALDAGLTVGGGTITWWLQQDRAARGAMLEDARPLSEVLEAFGGWLVGSERVWANGTDFDVAILRNAYAAVRRPLPWKYNAGRDLRTLREAMALLGIDVPRVEAKVAHAALDDAVAQAEEVVERFRVLRLFRPDVLVLRDIALEARGALIASLNDPRDTSGPRVNGALQRILTLVGRYAGEDA